MVDKSVRGLVSALMREGLPRFVPLVPKTDGEIKVLKHFYRKTLSALRDAKFVCFAFDDALSALNDVLPGDFGVGIDLFKDNFVIDKPGCGVAVRTYVDTHENLRAVYAANTPSEEPRMEFESEAFMQAFRIEWIKQMSAVFNNRVLVATKRREARRERASS